MSKSSATRRGSVVPGSVHLAVASAIAILIAMLPRTGSQTPPPTVAEFAPQAANQVRRALAPQSSDFGPGEGPCVAGEDCPAGGGPTRSPSPRPTIELPKAKLCFGDPPRQTEDPQSPPCVPYYGGKTPPDTHRGIVGGQIRVAVPVVAFESFSFIETLFDYFNKRFQFWGRTLEAIPFNTGTLESQPSPRGAQAHADNVASKINAFASLTYAGQFGAEHHYYDRLATHEIISIAHRAGARTSEAQLRAKAPYRWSVLPGIDTMQLHVAAMACKVLAGHAPQWAGPGTTAEQRIFGLVYGRAEDGTKPDLAAFRAAVSGCGVTLAADVEYEESSDQTQANARATTVVQRMIAGNVTSVICFCANASVKGPLMTAAAGQQFRPEWILSTYIDNDVDNSFATAPGDQGTRVMGVSFRNKWLARERMFWYRALKEADPNSSPGPSEAYYLSARYSSLLLLASGIQGAGPNLKPETFQQALHDMGFANPGAGAKPYYQARVGFREGRSHTMIHDATMFWIDLNERGRYDPANLGRVCYVDAGARYALGDWPSGPPRFFADTCGDS